MAELNYLLLILLINVVTGDRYSAPSTLPEKQVMVHLFEWQWTDIAKECENFLQHYGYGAVQVSPPNEHITLEQGGNRPWWIRYQPVSYKLQSRSGTRDQFVDMVHRCNKVGVRIIVDSVINHMVGAGQKFGVDGRGSTQNDGYDGRDGIESFPAVPYGTNDFNDPRCNHNIEPADYTTSAYNVRECRLAGLLDLNQGSAYVAQKIADYLNDLLGIGVAGFRIDATKHMWPCDLCAIYKKLIPSKVKNANSGSQPFIFGEVIDLGSEAVKSSEYTGCGRVTNFKYGRDLSAGVKRNKNFKYYANFGEGWAYLPGKDVVVFVDDHDNQRTGSGGVLNYKSGAQYVMAVSFMLAWPYGVPRVMSSYYFSNNDQGPPSSGSPNYFTKSPTFNPDDTCDSRSGWVCEHRWPAIRRMALFSSTCAGQPVIHIVTGEHRIAFSRGSKGFFVVNNGYSTWKNRFQTNLPTGTYCDVISGQINGGRCSGVTVKVDANSYAQIEVESGKTLAIHLGAKLRDKCVSDGILFA